MSYKSSLSGQAIIHALVFGSIAIMFITGLATWAGLNLRNSQKTFNRELAIQIAEGGIDYYRWHLAHAPQDFKDGTGQPGPYIHDFLDKDNNIIGQYKLTITPPPTGSTIVIVKSTGTVVTDPDISRSIQVQFAIPSLAKYAFAANADMRFGQGTEVFGPIHSNGGIHFDGIAHNIVTSAKDKYTDPDHGSIDFGVHTHVAPADPAPPAAVPNRPDVFKAGRQFPFPQIDFVGLTADLAKIKTDAKANGLYFANSGFLGYHIVLKTNGTFDLYKVKTMTSLPNGCNSVGQTGWGAWSIKPATGETFDKNYTFPLNGLIFIEDHVWVDGQINNARLTIASGRFPDDPTKRTNIMINNDLLYTNLDGTDVLSLIAQGNITAGLTSKDTYRVDAALIAQNGRIGRYYYLSPKCNPYSIRQSITLYGMLASNQRYGFAYADGNGYQIRNIIYDANLLYGPPPSFPLTSNQYVTLSWQEVK